MGILNMKSYGQPVQYKESENSLKIVCSLNGVMADFVSIGEVRNNFLGNSAGTRSAGFSRTYTVDGNKDISLEITAWNNGKKIKEDGVISDVFNKNRDETITKIKAFAYNELENKDVRVSYRTNEVFYKVVKFEKDNVLSYDYRTVYAGVIVRIDFSFQNQAKEIADIYAENFMKFVTLKILVDTGKITPEEYLSLKDDKENALKDFLLEYIKDNNETAAISEK